MNATKNTELPEKKSRQKYAELLCDFMFKRLFGSKVNTVVQLFFRFRNHVFGVFAPLVNQRLHICRER